MNQHKRRNLYYATFILCAFAFSQLASGEEQRLTVRPDPSDPTRTQCNIIFAIFTTPTGWTAHPSGKNTYAILTPSNEVDPNVTRMITIDVGKPVAKTAKETAEAFAEKWKGHLSDSELRMDGEPAFRVTIPPDHKTLRPVDCIITMKDSRVFFLIGGAKEAGDMDKVLETIVKSWTWKPSAK